MYRFILPGAREIQVIPVFFIVDPAGFDVLVQHTGSANRPSLLQDPTVLSPHPTVVVVLLVS